MASSGGAVAATLGALGRWRPGPMLEATRPLKGSMFFTPPSTCLSSLANLALAGTAYFPNPSAYALGRAAYEAPAHTETIIGTYNIDRHTKHLFSTATPDTTLFHGEIDSALGNDYRTLTRAVMASAAIPLISAPVRVLAHGTSTFQDGGVYSPSPLSCLRETLFSTPRRLKLIYVMSNAPEVSPRSILRIVDAFARLLAAASQREVDDAIAAFRRRALDQGHTTMSLSSENLSDAITLWRSSREALLIVKPLVYNTPYYFNPHEFQTGTLSNVMQRYRLFAYELVYTVGQE